jgi:predicted MFS family arabinose efflux permease
MRLWSAQVGSAFGSRITRTVLPMIAILAITADPTEIAVLSALGVAPGIVIAIFAGGIIDRGRKRPVLIGSDLLRAALILTIPIAAWLGMLSMAQLYIVTAVVGAASAAFQIADNSYLPTLVESDQLVDANSKLEATEAVAEAAGPGIAGALVQVLSAPSAMVVDAFSYLWSAWQLNRIRTLENPVASSIRTQGILGDAIIGFRACVRHPMVGPLLAAEAITYLFGGIFMTLYMVLALDALKLAPASVGLIVSAGGIGAFFGALFSRALASRLGVSRALILALTTSQSACLLIPLSLASPRHAVLMLTLQQIIGDTLLATFAILATSLRQRLMPGEVLARSNATFQFVTGIMLPAGALAAGPLAALLGLSGALWIGAIGGLLAVPALATAQRWNGVEVISLER